MTGREHMIVGTTATTTMGIGFLLTNNISNVKFIDATTGFVDS